MHLLIRISDNDDRMQDANCPDQEVYLLPIWQY